VLYDDWPRGFYMDSEARRLDLPPFRDRSFLLPPDFSDAQTLPSPDLWLRLLDLLPLPPDASAKGSSLERLDLEGASEKGSDPVDGANGSDPVDLEELKALVPNASLEKNPSPSTAKGSLEDDFFRLMLLVLVLAASSNAGQPDAACDCLEELDSFLLLFFLEDFLCSEERSSN